MSSHLALQGQSFSRLQGHTGFAMGIIANQDADPQLKSNNAFVSRSDHFFYIFNIGGYYAIDYYNEYLQWGIDANLNIGVNVSENPANEQIRTNFMAQAPVYATLRLGPRKNVKPTFPLGLGFGIGAAYSYFTDRQTNETGWGIKPAYMLEGALHTGQNSALRLRLQSSISPGRGTVENKTEKRPQRMTFWTLSLLYDF